MRKLSLLLTAMLFLLIASVVGSSLIKSVIGLGEVTATVETDPVPSPGDAADDPAIWIHPTNLSLSLVIGTDKKGGGLAIYDLAGNELQYQADGEMNNVDLRYNFPLGNETITLVAASNETADSIAVYRVNPATRQLENIAGLPIEAGIAVYGFCMYHSPETGKYYAFVTSQQGQVEQWELFDNGAGQVEGEMVRSFAVGSQSEGCVADDILGHFYISEESTGIWKYGAEPEDGTARTLVDTTGAGGHLEEDVEGLTLYYAGSDTGYLIASSQGSNEYVIYERQGNNAYVTTFEIVDGTDIDRVTNTDGIDVTNFPLGCDFPQGLFVAHDGNNLEENQNYKLVPWQMIAGTTDPPLTINTDWDPRLVNIGVSLGSTTIFLPAQFGGSLLTAPCR